MHDALMMSMQIRQCRQNLLGVDAKDLFIARSKRLILRLQAVRHHFHKEGRLQLLFV